MEDPVVVDLGHRDLGFEIALVDPARLEAALDDDIAAGQRGRHVAASVSGSRDDFLETGSSGENLGAAPDGGML